MLIINADDVGATTGTTDGALACFAAERITSASFMVHMDDSERAARLVRRAGLDVGLHLNFTDRFTADTCPPGLVRAQSRLVRFLRWNRYAQLLYNPLLRNDFAECYRSQVAEFIRLFGEPPSHVDGHHHMHLCANMVLSRLVPPNVRMRRHFSFWPGEKSRVNRLYRHTVDRWLARRYRLTDFFFDLSQSLQNRRLNDAIALARHANVEIMTHPAIASESALLLSDSFPRMLHGIDKGSYRRL